MNPYHKCSENNNSKKVKQKFGSNANDMLWSVPINYTFIGNNDGRKHVLAELVDTETTYVESLQVIIDMYMEPLKHLGLLERNVINEIFFQIPTILKHHELFLEALRDRLVDFNNSVGDILLNVISQRTMQKGYWLFVNNWKNANFALKIAMACKPELSTFLEKTARDHKSKLALDSLLIMPVQRIPRYELLIKALLKHTPIHHEDYKKLVVVLEKIRLFAVNINCASTTPKNTTEFVIEGWNAGFHHLIRHDIVSFLSTKCGRITTSIFMFSDCVVFTSAKRKQVVRKPDFPAITTHFWNECKFKLLMAVPIHCVKISEVVDPRCKEIDLLDADEIEDFNIQQDSPTTLGFDGSQEDCSLSVTSERSSLTNDVLCLVIQLTHQSQAGKANIQFDSERTKINWLQAFQEALCRYASFVLTHSYVELVRPLSLYKTRSGPQLYGSAFVMQKNCHSELHFWIASSDGHNPSGQEWSTTVWVGTLDGELLVFNCDDSMCVKNYKHRISYNSAVVCILNFETKVLVALGNGDVAIYNELSVPIRDWNLRPLWLTVGSSIHPVKKMLGVGSQLWCTSAHCIKVYKPSLQSLELEHNIFSSPSTTENISDFDSNGTLVWAALKYNPIIQCYSAKSYSFLYDIDITSEVFRVLSFSDDIIRQHKLACLRITAMASAADGNLWIGTSAGVLLTLTATQKESEAVLEGLHYGHVGQIRIIISSSEQPCYVLSAGEGYENFCNMQMTNAVHTDSNVPEKEQNADDGSVVDSSNYVLVWKIENKG